MSKLTVKAKITPLGGGCEVGRSCILLEILDKKIILDCGIHPSETSLASLPFFDK
jgi:cleavage and polyadenylation specificity factor subunit 3